MAILDVTNIDDFLTFVAEVGEDKIVGFIFNNSARRLFTTTDPFTLDSCVSTNGLLKFTERDSGGITYYVYKPLATIEAILVVNDSLDRDRINLRYIGG